ncbi:MAG: chemotaxis protein CheB [Bacteroidetes bacterium]|nr:chemotaxis protein CheB [Bacteroidota bacterium]
MIKVGVICPQARQETWIRQVLNDSTDFFVSGTWLPDRSVLTDEHAEQVVVFILFTQGIEDLVSAKSLLADLFLLHGKPMVLISEPEQEPGLRVWNADFPVLRIFLTDSLHLPEVKEEIREQVRIGSYIGPEVLKSFRQSSEPVIRQESEVSGPIYWPVTENQQADASESAGQDDRSVLLIGASTGGPKVILEIFKGMGPFLREYTVIVVQHLSHSFLEKFKSQIETITQLPVVMIAEGVVPERGTIYLTPVRRQFIMGQDGFFIPDPNRHLYPFMPNIDAMFRSTALVFRTKIMAVILSGLGKDGTEGCRMVRTFGGTVIAQEPATAAVDSMPGAVISEGLHHYQFPPREIYRFLKNNGIRLKHAHN